MLRGRTAECAALDRLLTAVQAGHGQVLVVRGEPGVGKTALLDYLAERAGGCRVARAVGVESEMELPFAGLHQLCAPLLDRLDRLPRPQAAALATAFGLDTGDPPSRFLVGVAVLSLLADVAEAEPLVCIVDDAHWLDQVSAQTLAFVGRRLLAERIAIVLGVREATDHEFGGLEELVVPGLGDQDARALLDSVLAGPVDEQVRERIVAETRGNPLALIELTRGLTPTELAGGFGPPDAAPLTGRIEKGFLVRLQALGADTRRLLLAAAADPVGDAILLWGALALLGITPDDAAAAEAAGLIAIGAQVRFRHPLVRSAVYRSASPHERSAVHQALAEATDADVDPDRHAWHRAAATVGPDEDVAAELQQSAGRARARGGLAASAAFLQRSVALTQDPAKRAKRALAAAQASLQAGEFEATRELLATAEAGPLDEFERATVDLIRAHVTFAQAAFASSSSIEAPRLLLKAARQLEAPRLLLKAARQLEPLDPELACETYLTAFAAGITVGGRSSDTGGLLSEVRNAVRALRSRPGDHQPLELLLEGIALLFTKGHAAAVASLQRAAEAVTGISVHEVLRWGWVATGASTATWDFAGLCAITERQVQLVRDAGALAHLPLHLAQLSTARAQAGHFPAAASLVAESQSVAAATGSHFVSYGQLTLLALQGREAEASATIASELMQAATDRPGTVPHTHWAAAVLYNGLARYHDAASAATQATSYPFDPWTLMQALPELVESATRAGDSQLARDAFKRLCDTTQPSGTDWALGLEARCRALLSQGAAAEELYREAIDRLSRTQLRPELARTHLLYGEWLRRQGRRIDTREQLHAAHDMFVAIGMEAFADRARRELVATGEQVRRGALDTRERLTPQEAQIAQLASDGRTNQEIGMQLFLSPRTVEWHLRRSYTKLGIRSRRELRGALARDSGATA